VIAFTCATFLAGPQALGIGKASAATPTPPLAKPAAADPWATVAVKPLAPRSRKWRAGLVGALVLLPLLAVGVYFLLAGGGRQNEDGVQAASGPRDPKTGDGVKVPEGGAPAPKKDKTRDVVVVPKLHASLPKNPKIGDVVEVPLTASLKMKCAWVPPGDSWLGGGGGKPGTKKFTLNEGLWCGTYLHAADERASRTARR
jgi:hypothetical protein